MIRIAQASSSENFTRNGIAPNQRRTGVTASKPEGNLDGELNIVNWNRTWECVYRAIDEDVAESIAQFFYNAVANAEIGYSWDTDTELFDWLKKHNQTNPAKVNTPVNTDCAALAGAAVYFSGIHADGLRAMVTWKEDEVLMSTNAFIKLTDKELCEEGKGIQRGDILWRTGHTACALDSNPKGDRLPMFYFQKISFNDVAITAGTPGTRAAQKTKSIAKKGYKIVDVRLTYVNDSSLANVDPFMGFGDEKRLCVNFYRASGKAGAINATIMVVYVRAEVTG